MPLHSRRTARAVAALTGAVLVLGLAPGAPAGASPAEQQRAPEIGLTWAELQSLGARSEAGPGGSGSDSFAPPQRRQVIADKRDDVQRPTPMPAGAERAGAQHADLTQLMYRTPARLGGTMSVTARWADYRNARRPGVRRQHLLTFLSSPRGGEYVMWVGNRKDKVYVFDLFADTMAAARIRPETVEVERVFGPGGTVRVTVSTEWLDADRVRFASLGFSGAEGAIDETRPSRGLDVGPVGR